VNPVLSYGLIILFSYLVGSIPSAVIAGYILIKKDIRTLGSGNAGASNVFRNLGVPAGVAVLISDFIKGLLPLLFLPLFWSLLTGEEAPPLPESLKIMTMLSIVTGHAFPLWAGFRGGKGVACSAGSITAVFPWGAPLCLLVFLTIWKLSRMVSLASLCTAWTLPAIYLLLSRSRQILFSYWLAGYFLALAFLITWLHRSNIKRIFKGEEPKKSDQKK